MWKSLHTAVATMANLFFRLSSHSPMCLLCNSAEESTKYLFLQCPWVETVWNEGSLTGGIGREGIISWVNWLNDIYDATFANRGEMIKPFSYIAITCWHIWKSRCNFIFKQQPIYPRQVIPAVHHSVGMFLEANRVPSNSLDSVSCLQDLNSMGSWDAFPLLAKCTSLGKAFQDCRWSWVPRSANKAADSLASRQSREVCDFVWVNRPPSSLVHVLCNDGLLCPH
ncbi:uncharacterized protein LOC126595464 [Malus sylvestris]|uniref:uncharacterized protein LOC126595464 n=1 Tax=Malus sylvestris TaxID=3752 RepID=UPI0021AD4377|nr:uncharacterized protein LOC126595464 [Malus sylvestris]